MNDVITLRRVRLRWWVSLCAILFLCAALPVSAQTANWLEGDTPPDIWNISCVGGACEGVITFSGPTEVYSNALCGVVAAGGNPALLVDSENKTVELYFEPPAPPDCTLFYDPVAGLEGSFGPLDAGAWTFFSASSVAQFSLRFTVPQTNSDGIIEWIPGDSPPAQVNATCFNGDCGDAVLFEVPTGVYSNECLANQIAPGYPRLALDPATRSVELWFATPAPPACTLQYDPVAGLSGTLLNLTTGMWSFYSVSAVAAFAQTISVGDFEVDFIPGESPPDTWTFFCDTSGCTGQITFSGPTPTYDNPCSARLAAGGVPLLAVDEEAREIELVFAPPVPESCSPAYLPVAGLGGAFSGLADGTWRFFADSPVASFELTIPVGPQPHSADQNGNNQIGLSELLRVIQFYNSDGYQCVPGTEDGFDPGQGDKGCSAHTSDYNPQDWYIGLSELLRLIQLYNSGGYTPCLEGEDGYCPGL